MIKTGPETASKPTMLCSYETNYHSMYQPSYDMGFVFYDEDEFEEFEESTWGPSITPASYDSGIQH